MEHGLAKDLCWQSCMENKQDQHILVCWLCIEWTFFIHSVRSDGCCGGWSRKGWYQSDKRENCRSTLTHVRHSGSMQLVVLQWWCKNRLQCTLPTPPSSLPVRVSFFPLSTTPSILNWHGIHQVGDQAGDSEVAPRLGLFTGAQALQRLWYFFFQMPGMESLVMGNTNHNSPWLLCCSFSVCFYPE